MFFNPEMLVRLEEPAGKMAATDGKKAASQQPKSGPNIGSLGAAVTGASILDLLHSDLLEPILMYLPINRRAASITAAPFSIVAIRISWPGQSTKETCLTN